MEEQKIMMDRTELEEFREYLYEREHAEATIRKYLTDLKGFFAYLGEDLEINKKRLLGYKEWLVERYAVSSVNSMLAAVNQFLEFLGHSELKLRRIKVQKSLFQREEKEMSQGEYRKLVETAKKNGKYQLALCMETIAVTGVRVSELKYFTVEQIRRGRIEVRNKGKHRRIFLTQDIRKKLLLYAKARIIRAGAVFVTRTGKPKDRSNLWSEMKAVGRKAGVNLEKIFPHNLRHLFARVYYQATKDLAGLADILGHSSMNVTRIYTSNTGKVYQKQLERITVLQI